MRFLVLTVFFLLSLPLLAQKENGNDPDTVFKEFASAYFLQDFKKLESVSIYKDNLKTLMEMPRHNNDKLAALLKELKDVPIKWYEPGENVKIHGGNITVNETMSNEYRRVGNVKMLDFVYVLQLKKMRTGEWRVDPTFMIQSVRKQIDRESKRKRKNFRVELGGELYYLNAGEQITVKDDSGKEEVMKLFKNDIQHYKDGRISFQYHKEMDVFPGPGKNGFVYTLNSDLGPEIHVIIYNRGSKLEEERDRFIKLWVENYEVQHATFEEKRLKDIKQSINDKEYPGKVMYVIINGKIVYNQFNFLEINNRVVGVFGKSKNVDAGLLNQYLAIVCENIKPAVKKGAK